MRPKQKQILVLKVKTFGPFSICKHVCATKQSKHISSRQTRKKIKLPPAFCTHRKTLRLVQLLRLKTHKSAQQGAVGYTVTFFRIHFPYAEKFLELLEFKIIFRTSLVM
jgi:hypothetical protein